MKFFFFLLQGISISAICFAQRPAQGPVSNKKYTPQKLGYKLFWEDQFNGNKLDTTKWNIRGKGARALGYVSEEAMKVENGKLKLFALKKDDSMLISAVGTQDKFMTKYGYFECRAQLQQSPGVWGAFWLQSPQLSDGDDNPSLFGAEIDIMEFFKKLGTDIVSHNVWWGPYGSSQHTTHGMQSYLKGVSKGFHKFALEWTPERYIFYIDGYKFYEVNTGISRNKQYIILSMEIPHDAKDLVGTVFPDVFVIDYIKVYKK